MAKAWEEKPKLDTPRRQALAYELASNVQHIARQLKHEYYSVEATALWEESGRILWKLHQYDPKRHQADLARSLHFHAVYLQRAGHLARAEPRAEEAVKLRRQLYNAHPDSQRCCSELASSLDIYAVILSNLNRPGGVNDACVAKKEASALHRKIFLSKPAQHPIELPVFARAFGEYLLQPHSESDS